MKYASRRACITGILDFAMFRLAFQLSGHLSLALGITGIFLPLLPTTPFILLSAYCYSKSSEKFHGWITLHPQFGPMIRNWQDHRIISKKAKWIATALLGISISFPLFVVDLSWGWKLPTFMIASTVLLFIHLQPSTPKRKPEQPKDDIALFDESDSDVVQAA